MVSLQVFLVASFFWASTAYKIFYVLPNNSTDNICATQHCATLSEHLINNGGSIPTIINVEYRFLPGKHQVSNRIILRYLHNFSLVGFVNNNLPAVVISTILIYNSRNVTVKNIILKVVVSI